MFVALAAALALLQATSGAAPTTPLFDRRPATIDGVRYEREKGFEGEYLIAFEASVFRPIGSQAKMWLSGWTEPGTADLSAPPTARSYHIRFIGRRTARPGSYGHMGAYRHMVLITDMIDARPDP